MQGVYGWSRACPGVGMASGVGENRLRDLANAISPLVGQVRSATSCLPRLAGAVVLRAIRPLGVVLYVAMAIVVMALVLRFAGIPAASFTGADLNGTSSQASETRSQELESRAQEILAGLSQSGPGFSVDGE
jgi:hypothetical protein